MSIFLKTIWSTWFVICFPPLSHHVEQPPLPILQCIRQISDRARQFQDAMTASGWRCRAACLFFVLRGAFTQPDAGQFFIINAWRINVNTCQKQQPLNLFLICFQSCSACSITINCFRFKSSTMFKIFYAWVFSLYKSPYSWIALLACLSDKFRLFYQPCIELFTHTAHVNLWRPQHVGWPMAQVRKSAIKCLIPVQSEEYYLEG